MIEIGFLLRRRRKNERESEREKKKEQVNSKTPINDAKDDEICERKGERERERVKEAKQQADLFWATADGANQ